LVGRAILSVLAQTFPDFELIVVNDGGTDDTDAVVADIADPRIRYIRLSKTLTDLDVRNVAVLAASGEYIAFLDDDDELMPGYLAAVVAAFASRPGAGFVFTGRIRVRDTGRGEQFLRYDTYQVQGETEDERRAWFFGKALVPGGAGSLAVRRSCLYAVGLWDSALIGAADSDLLMRLGQHTDFVVVMAYLYKVHAHDGRRMTDPALTRAVFTERILRKHRALLAQYPALWRDRHRRTGAAYFVNGSPHDGRRMLWPVVRRYPLDRRTWGMLLALEALALLPVRARQALFDWRRRVFKRDR
jgi:glycosyltransferase involved in cell wall biosynthesis